MTVLELQRTAARLFAAPAGDDASSLQRHRELHGILPPPGAWSAERRPWLLVELERSALTGRGGAGFPSHRKVSAVQSTGRRRVLVVNAMEGEPASAKDQMLLVRAPHLVLDGAEALALALHASRVVICLPEAAHAPAAALERAIAERAHPSPGVAIEIARLAGHYVAGEESALVAALAGGNGVPAFRPDKSVPLTLGRRAALVHNAETIAHIGLIAHHGAQRFVEVGAPEAPGTCLVTVSGGVEHPGVLEVETGTPLRAIAERARPIGGIQAVLVGGYGGAWVHATELETAFAPSPLRAIGAAMGAGVLVVLAASACGLREMAEIARYMGMQSAGQCGPCVFGLPAIADDLTALAEGAADAAGLDRLLQRCSVVAGRGACGHPDGVVRMVRSGLSVFAAEVAAHLDGAPCRADSSKRSPREAL